MKKMYRYIDLTVTILYYTFVYVVFSVTENKSYEFLNAYDMFMIFFTMIAFLLMIISIKTKYSYRVLPYVHGLFILYAIFIF